MSQSAFFRLKIKMARWYFDFIISFGIEIFTGILTIITLFSVILSFGVSVIIGIVFGIMPAKRAAKQDPVISLRN